MTTGPGTSGRDGGLNLQTAVNKLLPTPSAVQYGNNQGGSAGPVRPSIGELIKRVIANGGIDWREYEPAIRRWESIHGPVPFPAALGPKGGIKPAPEFVEWMMALPPGHVSSVPGLTINEQLKLLGNGVVPPQAEAAIRELTQEHGDAMTTQDTSGFFQQHQSRDVPRDQWGRYSLPGPDGSEQSWTRATTFAATLAEQYGLRIWKERQVVWGLSRRPDLLSMASTIAGPQDKKALGAIVDEAHIAAGTDSKANRGTAIHRAIQAAETGHYEQVPEEFRTHVASYLEKIGQARITLLPNYVERTVIVPEYQVAGTADNFVLCSDSRVRVLDKKTGRLDYSDTEFAVQMALYANAKAVRNYDTQRYEPMPENLATDYAILAHIDPESGHCELHRVNIEWGWTWARTCAEVMDIRKTKHVITPYVPEAFTMTESVVFTMDSGPMPSVPAPQFVVPSLTKNIVEPNGYVTPPDTVPGGYVDTTSPVPDEFQAFWSDTDNYQDDDTEQVNGVPVPDVHAVAEYLEQSRAAEFGQPEQLITEITPSSVGVSAVEHTPASPAETAAVASEGASTPNPSVDDLVVAILSVKAKAKVQAIARRLMASLGIKETDPDGIKLSQYQAKIATAVAKLALSRGMPIPGPSDDDAPIYTPGSPVTAPSATRTAPAAEEPSGPTLQQQKDEHNRVAIESLRLCTSVASLQERKAYYETTFLGWTDEMQQAARVRAAEIDQGAEAAPLTPKEMIEGATSRQTLSMAWNKATDGGRDKAGWTPELDALAKEKSAQLSAVAPSGNQ